MSDHWEIRNVRVSDSRRVKANVTGMPPLHTAKGNRPIDPTWIAIDYHIGTDRVYVEISGRKLFEERKLGYSPSNTTRRYDARTDALPGWANDLIEEHRPVEDEGWWR